MQEETSSTFFMLSCAGFSATSRGTEPISRDRAAAVCALQSSRAAAESASFQEIRPGSFLAEEPLTSALMLRQGRHGWIKIAQLLPASLKILVQFKFICQENKKTDFFFERLFSLLAPEASQCQEQQSPRPHDRHHLGPGDGPKFFPKNPKCWWLKLHVPLDSREIQEANPVLLPQLLSR